MKSNKAAIFFLCMFFVQIVDAQIIRENYTLKWHPPIVERISDEITRKYIYFDKAILSNDEKLMPLFFCEFPVSNENLQPHVNVLNTVWETLSADELDALDTKQIADTLYIKAYIESTRKKPDVKILFLPMRKNGNGYEKLVSFQIECSLTPTPPRGIQKSNSYANNSILRNGDFYKMSITQTGIHKVSHSDLVAMGIKKTIYTQDIALFGNGGKMLPESTSIPIADDLQEIAIQIVDQNGNGIFDNEDYILFYGVGIVNWDYTPSSVSYQQFAHELNFYSSQAYYFLTVDAGIGDKKRVSNAGLSSASPTHQVNSYYFRDVYEKDLVNVNGMSRIWFGEDFNATTNYKFPFTIPDRLKDKRVFLKIQVASKSNASAMFTASINGGVSSFSLPLGDGNLVRDFTFNNFISSGDNLEINLLYNKLTNSSIGYLDYIEVHTTCALAQSTGQFSFRNPEIVGNGNIAAYQFDTKGKATQIWDVTDPFNTKKINVSADQGSITFKMQADTLREFVAFDGSSFLSVTPVGAVANQNLHALNDLDFIIITHPAFIQAAEKLAAFRRSNDGMKVAVVTTTQVYNEFGSGMCDISAIRNFLKMFYDRAENEQDIPQNALLIGKTSFDPRNITGTNSCFIPNYQGDTPFNVDCHSTDNFFTKLADGKGLSSRGTMDMGVGRFSVSNTSQASILVEKSITYAAMKDLVDDSKGDYVSNMGDWRNIVSLIADDNVDYSHMKNPENVYQSIVSNVPFINFDKIYCDAYVSETSANGKRYPAVNNAINSRVNRGCLMMSYFGHGGDNGWAHERILQRSDMFSWNNKYCLPFLFTGCCNFANYDKKDGASPAEDVSLRANGGVIGLITSTRNTISSSNQDLSEQIHKWAFEKMGTRYLTLGEIHAKSQKDYGGGNGYDFQILLGDPSATLARPKWGIVTDSINGIAFSTYTDTIKALQFVTIAGYIRDNSGNKANNFNGWIYPTIFDKADTVTTLNPPIEQFVQQKNTIFKGKSKVTNGEFSFRFIVPKDIDYATGDGKISYYAKSEGMDALGYNHVLIGSVYDTVFNDTEGPQIKLYLNDEKFVSGGITDPNPIILAKLTDETGINTASSGIGHDIIAILDNNVAKSITLNDYFEFDENSFNSGKLRYPLQDLAIGKHTLTLRAWDVLNNMNEVTIDFEVVDNKNLELKHVLNYPNPFTTSTQFFFEHNRPNTPLLISVQIMTISGKIAKTIIQNQQNTGFRSDPVPWNGLDDFGDKLAKGVYVYKLKVIAPDGSSAEKIEKLVIL